jgi:hypothetical protein
VAPRRSATLPAVLLALLAAAPVAGAAQDERLSAEELAELDLQRRHGEVRRTLDDLDGLLEFPPFCYYIQSP